MVVRAFWLCATLAFLWACGGGGEETTTPSSGQPAATQQQAQDDWDDDDYEELDVWIEAEPDEGPPPLRVHFTSEVESEEENGGP